MSQARASTQISDVRPERRALTRDESLGLLQHMLRQDCTTHQGGEAVFIADLANWLARHGIPARIVNPGPGRANLVAELRGRRPGPHLVFSGHCDTVPLGARAWSRPAFSGEIAGGRIHGRGACDMKGGLAAMITAMVALAAEPEALAGSLTLAVTWGEETGSQGAAELVATGGLAPFAAMVIAEPSSNRVLRSHKGALWLRATAYGRTGHGSMPTMGVNALDMLGALAARMPGLAALAARDPLLGAPTLCLTRMEGGSQINVIPDRAWAEFDLRSLPGQDHADLLAEARSLAAQVAQDFPGGRLEMEIVTSLPALDLAPQSPLVAACLAARAAEGLPGEPAGGASYFTDGSIFQQLGPVVILGPGDPAQAHQTDEYLEIEDFHIAARLYQRLARNLLQPG